MPAGASDRIGRTFVQRCSNSRRNSCHRSTGTYCVRRPAQPDYAGCFIWFDRIAAEPHHADCAAGTTGDAPDRGNSRHRRRFDPCDAGRAAAADRGIGIQAIDTAHRNTARIAHSGTASAVNSGAAAVARNEDASTNRSSGIACIGRWRQTACGFPGNARTGSAYCCFAVTA